MTITNHILQDLNKAVGHIHHPLPISVKTLCALSENLLERDLFQTPAVMDKRKIYEALSQILTAANLSLPVFQQILWNFRHLYISSRKRWPLPLWEIFWMLSLDKKARNIIEFLDDDIYQGIYGKARQHLVKEALDHLASRRMKTLDRNQKQRILPNLSNWLSSFLLVYFLLQYKGIAAISRNATLQAMMSLLDLTLQGYGTLYAAGTVKNGCLEIRLPVWNEKDFPREIIHCKEMPELTVSVIQNGVVVHEKVWRPSIHLTAEDIFDEPNLEIRRMMMSKVENGTFLQTSKAELIHAKGEYQLYRVFMENNVTFHLVHCVCPSTGREYHLRVPSSILDAEQAIAWTFNEATDTYKPLLET